MSVARGIVRVEQGIHVLGQNFLFLRLLLFLCDNGFLFYNVEVTGLLRRKLLRHLLLFLDIDFFVYVQKLLIGLQLPVIRFIGQSVREHVIRLPGRCILNLCVHILRGHLVPCFHLGIVVHLLKDGRKGRHGSQRLAFHQDRPGLMLLHRQLVHDGSFLTYHDGVCQADEV